MVFVTLTALLNLLEYTCTSLLYIHGILCFKLSSKGDSIHFCCFASFLDNNGRRP